MSNRRKFLKNSALAAAAISSAPIMLSRSSKKSPNDFTGCNPTTQDFYGEGPFYTENPPEIVNGILASKDEPGTKLTISGRVHNLDCSLFLANTIIDVWHANNAGNYDNQGYNLRGQVLTNSEGFYLFQTIKPGNYLVGNTFRPSHIHFKIKPPESSTLTTQLYFSGDEYIPGDPAASLVNGTFNASNRIISLFDDGNGGLEGTFDIVLNAEIVDSVESIHIDKGIIYDTFPNPFSDSLTIKYGVYKNSKVKLEILDLKGNRIASVSEEQLSPEKYEAEWKPDDTVPDGHYFVILKINDLQVAYKKIQKISNSYGR